MGIRSGVVAAVVAFGVLSAPVAAWAHVSVNPGEAEAGGFARVSFRVPNERDDAGTTQVEVNMPEDHPIGNVSVQPVPGWEYTVERRTLDEPITVFGNEVSEVVGKVTFAGGRIAPGEFQEFNLSLGPLPEDAESLTFPAIQTYDSGEIVRWIEKTPESGEEPEHPVPTLVLTAATGDQHGGATEAASGSEAAAPEESNGEDDDSNVLAIIALVVGIAGLAVGGLAFARGSRR